MKFEDIYETHADGVYRFIYYKVFNSGIAEDLTADSFMKAYEKFSTYDDSKAAISTWLYTIARNTVIDYFRRTKPELHSSSPIEDIWDLAAKDNISSELEKQETITELQDALKELSTNERELVLMRNWDNLSYNEISKRLGKSPTALKMSYSRLVKKLQTIMNLVLAILQLHKPAGVAHE